MLVVSDTSPLNYLLLIDAVDVLPSLFREIYVPPRVAAELQSAGAPRVVQAWMSSPPEWLVVRMPRKLLRIPKLDAGEIQAISLADELKVDHLLIDEWAGREVAQQHGLHVVGTLGILLQAAERGLVDLGDMLERLTKTSFRIDKRLIERILSEHTRRKK